MKRYWVKRLSIIYLILLLLLLVAMTGRTGLYFFRTVHEFVYPSLPFHPEITPCSVELLATQGPLRGIYNYRSLGTPCQK